MQETHAAYLGGLFDGEGCLWFSPRRAGRTRVYAEAWQLQISMSDEDTIRRAHALAGCGSVHGPQHRARHRKPMWHWRVCRRDDIARVLRAIYPWLCARRRAKADEFFAWYEEKVRDAA